MPKSLEFGFIALLLGLIVIFRPLPVQPDIGQFVLVLAVVFLLQTLVRDLYLYRRVKEKKYADGKTSEAQCFCVESGIGMIAVVSGIMLVLTGAGGRVDAPASMWVFCLMLVMLLNYSLRDFVFSWRPWRIYRDPDHLNIIPRIKV